MLVGIDGYYLVKPRGMGRYVQELLYALGRYAESSFEFVVVVPDSVPENNYVMPDRIKYVVAKHAPFPLWEQYILSRELTKLQVDVAHFPYNTMPLFYNGSKSKKVVTVHDLIFMNDIHGKGGTWYQNFGNKYRQFIVSKYRPEAQIIVTDSQRSLEDIKSKLCLPSSIVYIATEYGIRSLGEKKERTSPTGNTKYMLHVGGTSPHKNTERCIQAFLQATIGDMQLVVLGLGNDSAIAQKYSSDKVYFPGWVSDTEMAGYFSNSSALLFPSIIEGYGLPIIEAFNLGVPVITSDLDPMREIAGGGALLVDPYSIQSMTNAICQILEDYSTVQRLRLAATQRLLEINGKNMAEKMLSIYSGLVIN